MRPRQRLEEVLRDPVRSQNEELVQSIRAELAGLIRAYEQVARVRLQTLAAERQEAQETLDEARRTHDFYAGRQAVADIARIDAETAALNENSFAIDLLRQNNAEATRGNPRVYAIYCLVHRCPPSGTAVPE